MEYTISELSGFSIIGISVRTTNLNNQSLKDIGSLWHQFFQEGIKDKIPNKTSDDIYCIYTNYESDFMGEYTTIIGCKVSCLDQVPENMIAKQIPSCKYQLYRSQGEVHECVGKTWGYIWQSQIERKYEADFDVYGVEAQDPADAVVYTYLSVK